MVNGMSSYLIESLGADFKFDLKKDVGDDDVMYFDLEFIAGGYAAIELESEDQLINLLEHTGLTANEIVSATFNGETINNLEAYVINDAGTITIQVEKIRLLPG